MTTGAATATCSQERATSPIEGEVRERAATSSDPYKHVAAPPPSPSAAIDALMRAAAQLAAGVIRGEGARAILARAADKVAVIETEAERCLVCAVRVWLEAPAIDPRGRDLVRLAWELLRSERRRQEDAKRAVNRGRGLKSWETRRDTGHD